VLRALRAPGGGGLSDGLTTYSISKSISIAKKLQLEPQVEIDYETEIGNENI